MTNICIHKYCSDHENKFIFLVSILFPNIWNISNDDDHEEEFLDTNDPNISDCDLSESLSSGGKGKYTSTLIML